MDIKRVEPSFGMAVRRNPGTPAINGYLKNLSGRTIGKLRKIIYAERENPIDVYMGAYGPSERKLRFIAEVGGKRFKENFFFGPVTTLKRAIKLSRKIRQKQEHINSAWGIKHPTTRI